MNPRLRAFAGALFVLASTACNRSLPELGTPDTAGPAGHTMVERLAAEAERLGALFRLDFLLKLALLVIVSMLVTRVVTFLVRLAWRLGLDAQRRLSWWQGGSRVVVGAFVLYVLGRSIARAAPILSAVGLVFLVVAASWVFSAHLQNALTGIGLLFRRQLRNGDRIQVGGLDGVVRSVGLMNLELVKADGSRVMLPNRLLNQQALTVAREKNSVPVRVRLRFDSAPSQGMLEQARRAALLSPYRAPRSSVEVSRDPDDLCVMDVGVQVWAAAAARAARDHLESSLRAAMPEPPRPHNGKEAPSAPG